MRVCVFGCSLIWLIEFRVVCLIRGKNGGEEVMKKESKESYIFIGGGFGVGSE